MIVRVEPGGAAFQAIIKRMSDLERGDAVRDVLKNAINETADDVKNDVYRAGKAAYTIKARTLKKSDIKKRGATKTRSYAVLQISGGPEGLREYRSRKNGKRKGVQVQVLGQGSMKELKLRTSWSDYKAFVATMPSGHTGVFERVPGRYMKKHMPGKNRKGREKIRELLSLSKSKIIEVVYRRDVEPDVQYDLNYRLLKHMNEVIGGIE